MYSLQFANSNDEKIKERIQYLFQDPVDSHHFYSLSEIVNYINSSKQYPLTQIYSVLTNLVNNKHEYIFDKYGNVDIYVLMSYL